MTDPFAAAVSRACCRISRRRRSSARSEGKSSRPRKVPSRDLDTASAESGSIHSGPLRRVWNAADERVESGFTMVQTQASDFGGVAGQMDAIERSFARNKAIVNTNERG